MTDTEIEDRLRATLRAKAAQVPANDEPFAPGPIGPPVHPLRRSLRGGQVWLVAVAAAILVVVLVGVALVRADRQTTVTQGGTHERVGLVAPGFVPDGYQLWDVAPASGTGSESSASGPVSVQLFGDGQGPRLLVQAGGAVRAFGHHDGAPVTVRGQADGTYSEQRSVDAPATQASQVIIRWVEQGVEMTAVAIGASEAEVLGWLDQLQWTAPGPLSGAEPASLPPLHLLGGTQLGGVAASAQNRYVYDRDAAPVVGGTGGLTVAFNESAANIAAYYETWLNGDAPGQDGSIEHFGTIPASLADPSPSFTVVWWSDGRGASVSGIGTDRATMGRMARSGVPTTEAALATMRAEVTSRILALPVIATAELAPLTLEVHGDGGSALCAHDDSGAVACQSAASAFGAGVPGMAVSMLVAGDWYVAGAGTRPFAYTAVSSAHLDTSNTPTVTTEADVVHWRIVDQGVWHFLVAPMPASVSDGAIEFDVTGTPSCFGNNGGTCATGAVVSRPTS